jgi:hypothetical protein
MSDKQLIEKLAAQALDVVSFRREVHGQLERTWSAHIYDRVFAELIILECAEVAACNAHVSGFALYDVLKQHFGIGNDN